MGIFDAITREHVLRALEEIKENSIPGRDQSIRYDLIHNNGCFPPKLVLSTAYEIATGVGLDRQSFTGGRRTNSKLEKLNFSIVPKPGAKFTDDEIKEFLGKAKKSGEEEPESQTKKTTTYLRSPLIFELTKHLSNEICDLCEKPAPFTSNNTPYLECHHIAHLAQGGPDVLENTVALCPNCHRRMHILDKADDREKLVKKAKSKLRLYQP